MLRHGRRARIAESNTKAKPTANGRIGNSVMSCKYPQRIGLALSGHNDRLRQVSERTAEGRSGAINVNTPPATARMASIHLLRVLDWMASARAERVMASHRATRYANPAPRDRPSLTGANEIYGPAPDDARPNCAASNSSVPATARSNVRRGRAVMRPNVELGDHSVPCLYNLGKRRQRFRQIRLIDGYFKRQLVAVSGPCVGVTLDCYGSTAIARSGEVQLAIS